METELLGGAAEVDFSLFALFWRAGLVVQLVMLVLLGASVWSWAIAIQKVLDYRRVRREAATFDEAFWSGEPLDELYMRIAEAPRGASAEVFVAGMAEWTRSHREDGMLIAGAQARIDRAMTVAASRISDRLHGNLGFLATVGATSPFVGLFGTVWGIMNVFGEIGAQQNTNLATVAPGIGEALAATALGLVAAIPAVIFYNKLSADADRLSGDTEAFAEEFSTILSRQLEA